MLADELLDVYEFGPVCCFSIPKAATTGNTIYTLSVLCLFANYDVVLYV